MKILFLHPNFPAQFRHLAGALAADKANQVVYLTARKEGAIPNVTKVVYQTTREVSPQTHRYVRPLEAAANTGQAAWRAAHQLKQEGFEPDVVYAHVGWGPGLFMADLFPQARYLGFFEWYYHAHGTDADFDPSEPLNEDDEARIRTKNAPILLELAHCDTGIVPTRWQKQQFPADFHHRLQVLHDGIDTTFCQPKPGAKLVLPPEPQRAAALTETAALPATKGQGFGSTPRTKAKSKSTSAPKLTPTQQLQQAFWTAGLDLSSTPEVVTYIARGMEPYRGFPQFMAAAAQLLKARSHCHVVIVGEDRVAYGKTLADGRTYREKMLSELDFDPGRLHFTGPLPYGQLLQVYQASAVHVYLTRPFVLSWSMLEAMACGCVVLGSRTPPVEEVITDGVNGFLVDFWDAGAISTRISQLLDKQPELADIRRRARETILERYDLAKLLPQHIAFLKDGL